jgi:hypothetical protein
MAFNLSHKNSISYVKIENKNIIIVVRRGKKGHIGKNKFNQSVFFLHLNMVECLELWQTSYQLTKLPDYFVKFPGTFRFNKLEDISIEVMSMVENWHKTQLGTMGQQR